MTIQILLTAALGLFVLYALFQFRISMVVSRLTAVTALVGLVFVWYPDLTTMIARRVGVGRGADLILYCFVTMTIFVSFYLQLRIQSVSHQLTELARAMALQSARWPDQR